MIFRKALQKAPGFGGSHDWTTLELTRTPSSTALPCPIRSRFIGAGFWGRELLHVYQFFPYGLFIFLSYTIIASVWKITKKYRIRQSFFTPGSTDDVLNTFKKIKKMISTGVACYST